MENILDQFSFFNQSCKKKKKPTNLKPFIKAKNSFQQLTKLNYFVVKEKVSNNLLLKD